MIEISGLRDMLQNILNNKTQAKFAEHLRYSLNRLNCDMTRILNLVKSHINSFHPFHPKFNKIIEKIRNIPYYLYEIIFPYGSNFTDLEAQEYGNSKKNENERRSYKSEKDNRECKDEEEREIRIISEKNKNEEKKSFSFESFSMKFRNKNIKKDGTISMKKGENNTNDNYQNNNQNSNLNDNQNDNNYCDIDITNFDQNNNIGKYTIEFENNIRINLFSCSINNLKESQLDLLLAYGRTRSDYVWRQKEIVKRFQQRMSESNLLKGLVEEEIESDIYFWNKLPNITSNLTPKKKSKISVYDSNNNIMNYDRNNNNNDNNIDIHNIKNDKNIIDNEVLRIDTSRDTNDNLNSNVHARTDKKLGASNDEDFFFGSVVGSRRDSFGGSAYGSRRGSDAGSRGSVGGWGDEIFSDKSNNFNSKLNYIFKDSNDSDERNQFNRQNKIDNKNSKNDLNNMNEYNDYLSDLNFNKNRSRSRSNSFNKTFNYFSEKGNVRSDRTDRRSERRYSMSLKEREDTNNLVNSSARSSGRGREEVESSVMIEVMDKLMREVVGEMSKKVVKEVVGEIMDEEDENNNLVSTAAQAVRDESLLLSWRNLAPRGAYLHRIFILTELFCTFNLVLLAKQDIKQQFSLYKFILQNIRIIFSFLYDYLYVIFNNMFLFLGFLSTRIFKTDSGT